MAISRIKKIEILGLEKDKEALLAQLQKLGLAQLIGLKEERVSEAVGVGALVASLSEIEGAISFLDTFRRKTGGLGGVIKFKPLVYEKQLQEVVRDFDYKGFLSELSTLRSRFQNILHHKDKLVQEEHLLSPWKALKLTLEEVHYKQHCGVILGVVNSRDYQALCDEAQTQKINWLVEVIEQDETNTHLLVFFIRDDFERLEVLLKRFHFNFVTLPSRPGTVKDRIFEIGREMLVLEDQLEDLKGRFSAFKDEQFKLMIAYDYLNNIKRAQEADRNLANQHYTFLLKAWIREKDQKALEEQIAQFKDIELFISEPLPDENVPVILENKRLIQPFEFITNIYGMPKYNELDPTPFLAPFFFLYFGFCVSDVGYGLILIATCFFMLKKLRLGPQGKRFFKLFLYCGISTIIVGALTGSWFGNLPDMLAESNKIFLPLKKFKDSVIVLDPLQQPTQLLAVALCLGMTQIWFGNIVAAIGNIKNRRYLDILFDQVTMLCFLFGLTGLGLIFLKLLAEKQAPLFNIFALVGAICLVLTQGRGEKGIGGKLFYGFFNLYNAISGYLSDVLSYSRLWALGLVTGVMASTINLISAQFSQIFTSFLPNIFLVKAIIGAIILVIVFVVGHVISFLMNLLGAFVHPVRLQFVEFFSKFFKSGGSTFRPFKIESKYIDIE